MEQKHKDLLMFFAKHKGEYFRAEDIPINIRSEFDPEMEIHDYLHEMHIRKLLATHPKKPLSYIIDTSGLGLSYTIGIPEYLKEITLLAKSVSEDNQISGTKVLPREELPINYSTINNNNSINIHNDNSGKTEVKHNYGAIIQNSPLSNAFASPKTETTNNTIPNKPKRSLIEIISWIVGIVAGLILIYQFIIK